MEGEETTDEEEMTNAMYGSDTDSESGSDSDSDVNWSDDDGFNQTDLDLWNRFQQHSEKYRLVTQHPERDNTTKYQDKSIPLDHEPENIKNKISNPVSCMKPAGSFLKMLAQKEVTPNISKKTTIDNYVEICPVPSHDEDNRSSEWVTLAARRRGAILKNWERIFQACKTR